MPLADAVLSSGSIFDLEFRYKLPLLYQVAKGISFLHENNIVHGDLRPRQVSGSGDGVVEFSDLFFDPFGFLADQVNVEHSCVSVIYADAILGVPTRLTFSRNPTPPPRV